MPIKNWFCLNFFLIITLIYFLCIFWLQIGTNCQKAKQTWKVVCMELYEIRAMIAFPCQNYAYYNILKSWGNNFCRRIFFVIFTYEHSGPKLEKKIYNEICVVQICWKVWHFDFWKSKFIAQYFSIFLPTDAENLRKV